MSCVPRRDAWRGTQAAFSPEGNDMIRAGLVATTAALVAAVVLSPERIGQPLAGDEERRRAGGCATATRSVLVCVDPWGPYYI